MFEYELKFRKTEEHANADALSRLPLTDVSPAGQEAPELVLLVDHLNNSPVTAEQMKGATSRDPNLVTAVQYIKQGWPHKDAIEATLMPYYERREELTFFLTVASYGGIE